MSRTGSDAATDGPSAGTTTGRTPTSASNSGSAAVAAADLTVEWAQAQGLEVDRLSDTHAVVTMPGERKLKTTVSVKCSDRDVDLQAFVIRKPDENVERFHTWLLQRNSKLKGLAFSIDSLGDVYLNASLPLVAWSEEVLDSVLGRFLSAAEESFNELLVIGFLTSMKKEWAWRVARGESTRNLQAFASLLQDSDDNEFIGRY
ncbi:YbjN domain-containing protein [Brevibacterium daeguense]|uniref:YbjN domain-containing protein n=1 Tax=Brevibacterium daeguense TaxID=909936 RepID=A0ABP8EGT3_9MICO|nr:YbjN domain-containing protein [Brevibacterium daeguense]